MIRSTGPSPLYRVCDTLNAARAELARAQAAISRGACLDMAGLATKNTSGICPHCKAKLNTKTPPVCPDCGKETT